MCQGIHRWLFVAWIFQDARARYAILKERGAGSSAVAAGRVAVRQGGPGPKPVTGQKLARPPCGGRAELPQNRREEAPSKLGVEERKRST